MNGPCSVDSWVQWGWISLAALTGGLLMLLGSLLVTTFRRITVGQPPNQQRVVVIDTKTSPEGWRFAWGVAGIDLTRLACFALIGSLFGQALARIGGLLGMC